jgi:hypothetical protein
MEGSASHLPSMELIQALINLEESNIPLDDFSNALLELALVDQFTGMEIQKIFDDSFRSEQGFHGVDHTVRVVFWVLYLVEISNRLGYSISEEEALAAVFAALVHDLYRTDELPGGEHGELASLQFKKFLQKQLSEEMLARCLSAVAMHGYEEEPQGYDPVWMLLKDADALDRSRFARPGSIEGCNPARLRLPVIKENTPVLEGCLAISVLLPDLIELYQPENSVFRVLTDKLVAGVIKDAQSAPESIQQAARLVADRYYSQH